MPTATIHFKSCLQDSQDLGTDAHMISRVSFDLDVHDHIYTDLVVMVKQPVGSDYESTPLEVWGPEGYDGPLNRGAFRRAVEDYYRSSFGSGGSAIRVGPGAHVRMRSNLSEKHVTVEIEHPEGAGGWLGVRRLASGAALAHR